jgi:hypothetical protein
MGIRRNAFPGPDRRYLATGGLPPGFVARDSGLIVTTETQEEVTRSPLSPHELRRMQEYLQALDEIMRESWTEEPRHALALVEECTKYGEEILERYGENVDRIALDLQKISEMTMYALEKAHDWYNRSGRRMPEDAWKTAGSPNLARSESAAQAKALGLSDG